MKKILSFLVLSILFLGNVVFAAQQSGTITLDVNNQSVPSLQTYHLPLDQLTKGVSYTIDCDIFKPSQDETWVALGPSGIKISVNGKSTSDGGIAFVTTLNKYKAVDVAKKVEKLSFHNTAGKGQIIIAWCNATPS